MTETQALLLAKALHMLRALRLSHPKQKLVSAGWGELGSEGGAELLKPSSCRCILAVMAMGLHSASSSSSSRLVPAQGVLGLGRGEDGDWLANLLPTMWQFSRCTLCPCCALFAHLVFSLSLSP